MISSAMPGALLIVSAIGMQTGTVGELLLKLFSLLSGGLVIYISIKDFQKPGSSRWLGADMTMVFTGFLILAIGSRAFDPMRGFQPAHLYFLTAFLMIFKGVMFPDAKIKRGFLVGKEDIVFRKRAFGQSVVIAAPYLNDIRIVESSISFVPLSGAPLNIDLTGYEMLEETREAIVAAWAAQRAGEISED